MNSVDSLMASLSQHQELAGRFLALIEQDARQLDSGVEITSSTPLHERRALLAELDRSLSRLRSERQAWQQVPAADKARYPQVTPLMRSTQDVLMRAILRDRENERQMLRAGRVPTRHLGKVQADIPPNYVANLYRRHQAQ